MRRWLRPDRAGWNAVSRTAPTVRTGSGGPAYGVPLKVAVPVSGRTRPSSIRMVVVLPAPLGPRKPVTDPGSTVNERSETARTGPNALLSSRPWTRTAPAVAVLPIEMGLSCRSAAAGLESKRTGAVRGRVLRGPARHGPSVVDWPV